MIQTVVHLLTKSLFGSFLTFELIVPIQYARSVNLEDLPMRKKPNCKELIALGEDDTWEVEFSHSGII